MTLASIANCCLSPAKSKPSKESADEYPEYYSRLVERLEPLVGSRISIKRKATAAKNGTTTIQGKITIDFESDEQVQEILKRLEKLDKKK